MSIRHFLILGLPVLMAVFAVLALVEPIPQDPEYHLFADNNTVFAGIPNTWNVFSNFPL